MPRSLLYIDRRLVYDESSRRLIVFDSETGAGAECCCGPSTGGGLCCNRTDTIVCTRTNPQNQIVCNRGRRIDFTATALMTFQLDVVGFDDNHNTLDEHQTASLSRSAGTFAEITKPNKDDLGNCGDVYGSLPYSLAYQFHQHGLAVAEIDKTFSSTNVAHSPFEDSWAGPNVLWHAWNNSGVSNGVADRLLNNYGAPFPLDVPKAMNGRAYEYMQGRHVNVAGWAGLGAEAPWKSCSGMHAAVSDNPGGGSRYEWTFAWQGNVSCGGGFARAQYTEYRRQKPANFSGPADYTETIAASIDVTWSTVRTLCPPDSGDTSGDFI